MNSNQIHNVYFIGIGGIGMSALAKYFKFLGKAVAGYDKTTTPLTEELEGMGIAVHYNDDVNAVQSYQPENTLVVYTPAVPKTHQ